ncbi:MAG: ScyD/ScyE family protein [Cytophagales bacterium]|nr:ScyD/ScyE family protein [Cytophagales bacterium]
MRTKSSALLLLAVLLLLGSCREHDKYFDEAKPPAITAKEFATGLAGPLGLAVDPKGHVWVTEVGTGHNDGKVSVITPNGKVYPVITQFASVISPEGLAAGLGHLVYKDGVLYILNGVDGKLYLADVSSFKPGDAPRPASELRSEDIATFVIAYPFEVDTEFSNLYNLAFGPDGGLYIADAGANAVIRRSPSGQLSVLAAIPGIPNPTPGGTAPIDAVPTGIVYDGEKFLVSTLTGFPFPEGKARIYQVSKEGLVSVYRDGFTALVDIALGPDNRPVVLQFAAPGPQGFAPSSGRITRSTTSQNTVLLEGLNLPAGIARRSLRSYYVTSLADGKVLRVE